MSLRMIITNHPTHSIDAKQFDQRGGTIGRSLQSDWVLPDPQRLVSSRHATIDYHSGSYYIVDTSTNGVYINGAGRALGRGKPQRLFDGDRLMIADYEIGVEISDGSGHDDWDDELHADQVGQGQRVENPQVPGGDRLDAKEVTGVSPRPTGASTPSDGTTQIQSKLRSEPNAKPGDTAIHKTGGRADTPVADESMPPRHAPSPDQSFGLSAPNVLDPFFRGAGLSPRYLDRQQTEAMLMRLGQLVHDLGFDPTSLVDLANRAVRTLPRHSSPD